MLNRIDFENFNGFFYIEPYRPNDHIYYYDQHKSVIDYIDTTLFDCEEFNTIVEDMQNSQNIGDFLDKTSYDIFHINKDRFDLMKTIYSEEYDRENEDPISKSIMEDLRYDDYYLSPSEFCAKYLTYQIGDYYIYIGEFWYAYNNKRP